MFPVFTPSTDTCIAAGNSSLYALSYLTGGPYSSPVIGTNAAGTQVAGSTSLGEGLATTVALHIGAQGNGSTGGGSQSGLVGCSQASTGALGCVNIKPPLSTTSGYISWQDQRN